MKYLIPLILLFPSLAFAVDDAMVSAIDGKASNANIKADGNNSRIQALEEKDVIIETLKADKTAVHVNEEAIELNRLDVLKKADKTLVDANLNHIGALEAEDILLHGKIDAVESLPVGADTGDILYWNGSVWQLTPAPPVDAATPPTLTLIEGVPTWSSTGAVTYLSYAIGDTGPAGGIVFYITDGGVHGLEVAPVDLESLALAEWGCYGTELVGADRTAVGTGAQNTADILSGCAETGIAAKFADAYELNGYEDWYLPSKGELFKLMLHQDIVDGISRMTTYWSSSEYNDNEAWYHPGGDMMWVFATHEYKGGHRRVLPVRAF